MSFPKVIFGKCPICGGGGENDPSPGSAFSTEDHTGEGYELVYYQGKPMCKMCKKRLMAKEESEIKSAKYREEQEFWEKSGVKKNMS